MKEKNPESVEGNELVHPGDIFVSHSWKLDQAYPNRSTAEESLLPRSFPPKKSDSTKRVTNSKDHQLFLGEATLVFPASKVENNIRNN